MPPAKFVHGGMLPKAKRSRPSPSSAAAAPPASVFVRATPNGEGGRSHRRVVSDLRWHFPMLSDEPRNARLCAAVHAAVVAISQTLRSRNEARGVRVLDIGSGSGLLALAAARAGAEHVTACEVDPLVASAAAGVIKANGFDHTITLLSRHSSELTVQDLRGGQPVDLVTHELLDSTLLGEQVLPTLRHAFACGLTLPGALAVPHAATITAQLVQSTLLWARRHPPIGDAGSLLAKEAACCVAASRAQSFEASTWLKLPQETESPSQAPLTRPQSCENTDASADANALMRCVGDPFDVGLSFDFARPPPCSGQQNSCVVTLKSKDGGATVHGVIYWWTLLLLPPGVRSTECETISTAPWVPVTEHWWQGACVLAKRVVVTNVERPLQLMVHHDDESVWFDTERGGIKDFPPQQQTATENSRIQAAANSCSCTSGMHAVWSSSRLVQLADTERQRRYESAIRPLISALVRVPEVQREARVILAMGVWIGSIAAQLIRAEYERLPLPQQQQKLRVCILEGGDAARQLARVALEAQGFAPQNGSNKRQHSNEAMRDEIVYVCARDWSDFDPVIDLPAMSVCAVIAEPWFRGVGQSWGPAAVVQMQEMVRSLERRSQSRKVSLCRPMPVIPASGTVVACLVECSALWAGQQPLERTCARFDLRPFNTLRCPDESIAGVPLWAHSVSLRATSTLSSQFDFQTLTVSCCYEWHSHSTAC